MVELVPYADLTWPEVVRLPRTLPLLIPLGRDVYDYPAIARQVAAEQAAILPPIVPATAPARLSTMYPISASLC